MELTTNDRISGSEKAKRFRDQSEDVISSSSPVASYSMNRRTQQVICTGTAPGILTSASGAFMMTQDKDNVFRLFDALSQEVLWMCDSRKELELIEYCPVSNKILARVTVLEPETAKAYQLAVWDLNTGNMLLLPKATQRLIVRCINHAGTRIIVSEGSEYYRIWDMDSGSELFRFQLNAMYSSMACCFARDDSKVAIVGHTLGGTNIVIDIWEVAPRLGHQMFSTNVKSSSLICQVTSSCNNKVFAMATYHDIFVVDLSSANVSKLLVTAEFWYGICFGCDDCCIVALSFCGSQALGVYRIADSVTLFRVPVQFYRAILEEYWLLFRRRFT
jgi:WD40 repeat protein